MKLFTAIKSFFKVGVIGFGGGTALIPVVEREVIVRNGLISPEQFSEDMVLQGITPGAFPIKMGVSVGLQHSGYGATLSAYATSFFGAFLAILITALLTFADRGVLTQISFISVGISAFIVLVIFKFITKIPKNAAKDSFLTWSVILMIFAVLLSCSDKLSNLISIFAGREIDLRLPELSTAVIILLGVNFSLFTRLKKELTIICIVKYAFAIIVTVLSVLTFAKEPVIKQGIMQIILALIIAAMLIYAIAEDFVRARKSRVKEISDRKKLLRPLVGILFALIPVTVMTIVCFCLPINAAKSLSEFVGNSVLSVLTTFGGGTAFISVAEGIFVEGGFITSEYFWVQVVPIGNSLPGPLLVKMLASIGFNFAYSAGANVATSLMYGIYGATLGASTTIISFLLIYMLFERVKGLMVFSVIKKGILPLIAGLLIPTIIAMITNMLSITISAGINVWYATLLVSIVIALCSVCIYKFRLKEPYLIVLFGGLSVGVLNLIVFLV